MQDWLQKICRCLCVLYRLPRWCSSKESTCQCGDTEDTVSIPGSGRSPGAGNGNPLQNSCLENSMDRGAWQATVHGVTKELDTTEHTHTHCISHICICVLYYICISICTDIYQGNTIKMDSIVAIIEKKKKKRPKKWELI